MVRLKPLIEHPEELLNFHYDQRPLVKYDGTFGTPVWDPDAQLWRMFYHAGANTGVTGRIRQAISYNGKVWEQDSLSLDVGPADSSDESTTGVPVVWYEAGQTRPWRMMYRGYSALAANHLGDSSTCILFASALPSTTVAGPVWERKFVDGTDIPFIAITSAVVASNILTITTATNHGFSTGDYVRVGGVTSPVASAQQDYINTRWRITVTGLTTFTLDAWNNATYSYDANTGHTSKPAICSGSNLKYKDWDDTGIDGGNVILIDGVYHAYYSTIGAPRRFGVATSTDLVTWTKDTLHNPLFVANTAQIDKTGQLNGGSPSSNYGYFCGAVVRWDKKDGTKRYVAFMPHYKGSMTTPNIEVWTCPNQYFHSIVTFTIADNSNATAGAIYQSASLQNFTVLTTKVSGDGALTLICSAAEPAATGTLTKYSGTGDATIAYSAYATSAPDRTYIGDVFDMNGTTQYIGGSVVNSSGCDTPRIVTDDITQNVGTTTITGNEIRMLLAVFSNTTAHGWNQAFLTFNKDLHGAVLSNVRNDLPVAAPVHALATAGSDANTVALYMPGLTRTLYDLSGNNIDLGPSYGIGIGGWNKIDANGVLLVNPEPSANYKQAAMYYPVTFDIPAINAITGSFTLEATVNMNNNPGAGKYSVLIDAEVGSGTNRKFYWYINDAADPNNAFMTLAFYHTDGTPAAVTINTTAGDMGTFTPGVAYKLAVCYDAVGGNVYFYKDRTLIRTVSAGAHTLASPATMQFYIGQAQSSANYLDGYLDNIRVSSVCRYSGASYTANDENMNIVYTASGNIFTKVYDYGAGNTTPSTLTPATTVPENTSVTQKVRTAVGINDLDTTIGDFGTYPDVAVNGRYAQQSLTLATSDTTVTPAVSALTDGYNYSRRLSASGTRTTTDTDNFVSLTEVAYHPNVLTASGIYTDLGDSTTLGAPMGILLDNNLNIVYDGDDLTLFWQYQNSGVDAGDMHACKFNPETGVASGDQVVQFNDDRIVGSFWMSPHMIVRANATLCVAFYSADVAGGRHIYAGVSTTGKFGPYNKVAGFDIWKDASSWEDGTEDYLESDPGCRFISEDSQYINMYILYSAQGAGSAYAEGWAKVQIDKTGNTVTFVEKYAANPLSKLKYPANPVNSATSGMRDGGSLPYKLGGYWAYWGCPSTGGGYTLRLSHNSMFDTVDSDYVVNIPTASIAEKGMFFPLKNDPNKWALIYQLDNNTAGYGWYVEERIFQVNTVSELRKGLNGYSGSLLSNGSSTKITVPAEPIAAINSTVVSICGFIKGNKTATRMQFCDLLFAAGTTKINVDWTTADKIRVGGRDINTGAFQSKTTALTLKRNKWYSMVAIIDIANKDVYLYLDGEKVYMSLLGVGNLTFTSNPLKFEATGKNTSVFGMTSTGQYSWGGNLSDIRIYNRKLSDSEIKSYTTGKSVDPTGLILRYKLESDVTDSSGNGYDGTGANTSFSTNVPISTVTRTAI